MLDVLKGRPVTPVPVSALHPGLPWFGPGYYIRCRFFDLVYRHVKKSGSNEKAVCAEALMELELEAHAEVFRDIMPLPACLSPLCLGETKIPTQIADDSRIVLTQEGFVWLSSEGRELLQARKDESAPGGWVPPDLQEGAVSSLNDVDAHLEFLRKSLQDLRSGKLKRPLADYRRAYESGVKIPDWRRKVETGCLKVFQKLKETYGSQLALIEWQNPPFSGAYFWLGEEYYNAFMMLIALKPDTLRGLLEYFLPRPEEHWESLRDVGFEVIFLQEFMTGAEIVNPRQYANVVAPDTRRAVEFFQQVGFKVVIYWGGSAIPVLSMLKEEVPFDGIIIEETRKGYDNDVGKARDTLGPEVPLFGNIDINLLENGSRSEILNEVSRQISAAGADTPFVVCPGSPITYETPAKNIRAFCESTRLLAQG